MCKLKRREHFALEMYKQFLLMDEDSYTYFAEQAERDLNISGISTTELAVHAANRLIEELDK